MNVKDKEIILKYRKRDDVLLHDTMKVYFCAHPEDFKWMFDEISDDILRIFKMSSIWYYDPSEYVPDEEDLLFALSQMQMFVVPVSSDFLNEENRARCFEFKYAADNHIPIIPLLQERGIEGEFNRICGDIELVDKYGSDDTQIPYEDKISKLMQSVFFPNKEIDEIRNAFDTRIFLSYRKKDRAYALKIMERIHSIERFRTVSIWYDEFLIPGNDYNDGIEAAINESDLFVVSVTDSLLEMPNYIKSIEFPSAVRANKKIIGIWDGCADTDRIKEEYPGMGALISINNEKEIVESLSGLIAGADLKKLRDNAHRLYLLGAAYIFGVGVEVNKELGLMMLMEAANANDYMACERLAEFYSNGIVTELDKDKALQWRRRTVELLEDAVKNNPDAEYELTLLIVELGLLEGLCVELNSINESKGVVDKIAHYSRIQKEKTRSTTLVNVTTSLVQASLALEEGRYEEAIARAQKLREEAKESGHYDVMCGCYDVAGEAYLKLRRYRESEAILKDGLQMIDYFLNLYENFAFYRYKLTSNIHLACIKIAQYMYDEAMIFVDKAYETYQLMNQKEYLEIGDNRDCILLIGTYYAALYTSMGNFEDARLWRRKCLDYTIEQYECTDTVSAKVNLADAYFKMAIGDKLNEDIDEKIINFNKSIEVYNEALGKLSEKSDYSFVEKELASVYVELGKAYWVAGKNDESDDCIEKAISYLNVNNCAEIDVSLCDSFETIIMHYLTAQKNDMAEKYLKWIVAIIERNNHGDREQIVGSYLYKFYNCLGDLLCKQNRDDEASAWYIKGLKYEKNIQNLLD